ncbi:MAG: hypothetical protein M3N46_13765 [Actinomycetota bacterium]|nr:hypothetical protein [Actinomycetota bacterium]
MSKVDEAWLEFSRNENLRDADPRRLRRAAEQGRLIRIHRGAFLEPARLVGLTAEERYAYLVLGAAGAARTRPIVSHLSAAVLWGAPLIGPTPTLVHVLVTTAAGTRTEHGFRKHASPVLDRGHEVRGEVRLTSLTRTLAETAADSPFVAAVGILDWALSHHDITKVDILTALDEYAVGRGRRRAERVVSFADGRAGSVGESLSRVRIHEAGLPRPELQVPFFDSRGKIGVVDFWWPDHNLIGEFDGVAKYVREEFTGGRDVADVVINEKVREDRLRAVGPNVTRWGWSIALSPFVLRAQLLQRGLPLTRA